MKKTVNYEAIKDFKPMRASLNVQDAVRESSRCLLCADAPCSQGCPAGTDPAKFIRQIRFENYKGAARTIRNNNVFGLACAHTCPVEKLCEKACSSKLVDGPINIAGLQQFACEYGCTNKLESFEKVESHGKKVAVIGSGPAGLACATELAKKGFSVTVFEKENSAGGVPVQTIPSYRLPNAAISDAVNTAKQLGVNFVFGKTISGKDAVKNLLNDGYKACFVSTGLVTSTELPLFNGFQNVANAKSFLNTVKFGSKPNFNGKNVAVIGGGSVAMDAAITAKALGASNVYAVSLEALNELPADPEEIELARGAHVTFIPASQITEVVSEGKNISALKGVNITWAEAGNFSPANARPVAGTSFTIKADYVIQAIGSSAGAEIKELATGLKHKGRGTIAVSDAFATDVKGVFAGGDIVNGGASIAQAVGEGKKAAESIHRYLLGTEK